MTSHQNLWPVTAHPHSKSIAALTRQDSDISPSGRRTKSLLAHPCSCASHRRRWWSISMQPTCERRNTWCLGLMHRLTEAQWREKAHEALGGSKIHWGTKNDQLECSSRPFERSVRLQPWCYQILGNNESIILYDYTENVPCKWGVKLLYDSDFMFNYLFNCTEKQSYF